MQTLSIGQLDLLSGKKTLQFQKPLYPRIGANRIAFADGYEILQTSYKFMLQYYEQHVNCSS